MDQQVGRRWRRGRTRQSRIDLVAKGDAETIVLYPGNRPFDPTEIAQRDPHHLSARRLDRSFGHQATGRKIAHTHTVLADHAVDAQIGHDEQAVARDMPMLVVVHFSPHTPAQAADAACQTAG